MAPKEPQQVATGVEAVIFTCQRTIQKKRVRMSEFFVDFDRLRCGLVHPNHFVSGLSIAGIDKAPLSANDLDLLKKKYSVKKNGGTEMIDYKSFCADVEQPVDDSKALLSQRSYKNNLTESQKEKVNEILFNIMQICQQKGILIKPVFVDFANSNNSTKLVGHVTKQQFHRTLDCNVGIKLSEEDVALLCEAYSNPEYTEMLNYVAFSNDIAPEEAPYDPYKET